MVIDEIRELLADVEELRGAPRMVAPSRSLALILERLGNAARRERMARDVGDRAKQRDPELVACRLELKHVAVEAIRAIESLDGCELAAYFRQTTTTPEEGTNV